MSDVLQLEGSVLETLVGEDPVLQRCLAVVASEACDDPSHDLGHLTRVALWAVRLAPTVPRQRVVAAALLHDIVNVPKNHPDRARASTLSAERAREVLTGYLDEEALEEVCLAIRDHSFSAGHTPSSDLGRALQDADRLEALGALGLFRNVATGQRMGSVFFHPTDPWGLARARDDRAYTLDHWFVKLRGLPATMQTPAGRAEAERRADVFRALLRALGDEIGVPAPDDL